MNVDHLEGRVRRGKKTKQWMDILSVAVNFGEDRKIGNISIPRSNMFQTVQDLRFRCVLLENDKNSLTLADIH